MAFRIFNKPGRGGQPGDRIAIDMASGLTISEDAAAKGAGTFFFIDVVGRRHRIQCPVGTTLENVAGLEQPPEKREL